MTVPKNSKLVSIIVPVFNSERFFDDCLLSISAQSYGNIEVIIVDDGSDDSSAVIAEKYVKKDRRFRIIKKPNNSGSADARNIGVNDSRGDYIAFVDSDDVIAKTMIEQMVSVLEKNDVDLVRCIAKRENKKGSYETEIIDGICGRKIDDKNEIKDIIHRFVTKKNNISCYSPTLLVRKKAMVKYNTELTFTEDTEFYVRLFLNIKSAFFLKKELYFYRYNNSSQSRTVNTESVIQNINSAKSSYRLINGLFEKNDISQEGTDEMLFTIAMSRVALMKNCKMSTLRSSIARVANACRLDELASKTDAHALDSHGKIYRSFILKKRYGLLAILLKLSAVKEKKR